MTTWWGRQTTGTEASEIHPCRTHTWSGQLALTTRMRPGSTSTRFSDPSSPLRGMV